MKISVTCGQCGRQYAVSAELCGKRAKCKQCGNAIAIPLADPAPDRPSLYDDLSQPAASPTPAAPQASSEPAAVAAAPVRTRRKTPNLTEAGPSDRQTRLGAAVAIPLALLGMAAAIFGAKAASYKVLVVAGLGPMFLFFAIAGLIDPNIIRAAGKYGKHLPMRYKMIAFAVGLAGLACGAPLVLMLMPK